jgi:hypothetical protein
VEYIISHIISLWDGIMGTLITEKPGIGKYKNLKVNFPRSILVI